MADQGSAVKRFIRKLEVPPPKGDNYATTLWVNSDLIPLSSARRTWGSWKYVVYWATGGKTLVQNFVMVSVTGLTILLLGFAIYNYNTGSALIAYGLSAKQCLAAGILSPIVLAIMCILCGVSICKAAPLRISSTTTIRVIFVGR